MAASFVKPFVDHLIDNIESQGRLTKELTSMQIIDQHEAKSLSDHESKLMLRAALTYRYSQCSSEDLNKIMNQHNFRYNVNLSTDFQMGAVGY